MTDYDCKTNGHHWIDHPEDGRFCFYCDEKYDFVQLYNRIEKLEAALRNIAEGDIPRTVKIPFYDDGKPSKHDRCDHGHWFYEECGICIEDYARKTLEEKDDPQADL